MSSEPQKGWRARFEVQYDRASSRGAQTKELGHFTKAQERW